MKQPNLTPSIRPSFPGQELYPAELRRWALGPLASESVHSARGPARDLFTEEAIEWKRKNWENVKRGFDQIEIAYRHRLPILFGRLSAQVIRRDGEVLDLGLISLRVVTNNGVAFIVDAFQNTVELENLKFHGLGTGTVAEAAGDSALGTELTTQYNPDNTRATGSTTESASNIYRTVGTNTVDASAAITEHGIFSQAATGGGTLLDRSVFSVINLANGDSLQTTYDLTVPSGG